jgi:ribosomal protein L16 Arg81 hydroxylase
MSPRRASTGAELTASELSTVARALSFEALLQPIGVQAFMRTYWGRSAWSHRIHSSRFEPLLTWERLNTLIRDHRPTGPRFRLVKAGQPLPETAWHRTVSTLRGPLRLLDGARLMAELRAGASIVWDGIDQVDEPLRTLKRGFERALQCFVFVNLYASFGTVHGFPDHWDDHDVFVLQLAGRKRWRVHPPTRPWPLADEALPAPPVRYAHNWMLRAGGALYLPRGWWHRVTPLGEPSLHLTIGVLRPTNLDLLRWLLEQAEAMELLRQDLPMGSSRAGRVAHAKALRGALADWVSADGIAAYERAQVAAHFLEPRPTLQAVAAPDAKTWDPDAGVLLLSTRAQLATRGNRCMLRVAGGEWSAPVEARRALRALVAGEAVPLGTLLEAASGELVSELVSAGVLALA